ncbi:uncharacterized protein K02A2.6-like [Sitophilus oryzae]|uniref:Uncharacterized protein K02A2.6-like n=1 Tax=Sitophilus oryzae TaxID=7048 RepID=A0A6J2YPT8_SITOR|nr:uncharacterized protein K02A2.6-like [Sitophilus oryzae]
MGEAENPSYYGKMREFSAQNSDWRIYKRRLENYFTVNGITDNEKRKALLLNALDEEAYKLIYNLALPRLPEDKTYNELTELFNTHFKVAESVFVARSKFFTSFKDTHENATEWAARVRIVPKFVRARPIPYGIRERVELELRNLENFGIIKPVDFSSWATPIVPVLKKSGEVRICGDFKITLNPVLEIDPFPLPRIEDLFSYQRLPYGIACGPSKFQKIMESLTQDMEGCVCFLDDILVCGRNPAEHLNRMDKLLSRLQDDRVCYSGYIIDKEGLHTTTEKINAIKKAPAPNNAEKSCNRFWV